MSLIKEYRDTIRFAQLADSDTLVDLAPSDESDPMNTRPELEPSPAPTRFAGNPVVREFAVPLPSGAIAAFKIPFPMSEEDFKQYSALLNAYKTAIVKKAVNEESDS
jgi:hypothetical protein